jgi:hypothetical protein
MSHVIGNILDTSPGFEKMHSNRMAKRVEVAGAASSLVRIGAQEVLYLAFLQGALPSGKEIWRDIPTHASMGTQKFCRVSPQRFLFTDAFLRRRILIR